MSKFFAMIGLVASFLVVLVPTAKAGSTGGVGWEYTGSLGPDKWHEQFPDCGGRMQSPININTNRILYDPNLQPFDLRQYVKCKNCTMKLENVDGHTAEVKFSGEPIIIKGGGLPDEYILDQFHFHWGADNSVGSEHTINSKAAPMEMHIVHHMKQFNKSQSLTHPYGLAVLGFFFKIGGHNDNFDVLLKHFGKIIHRGNETEIEPFALLDLLPEKALGYYRYFGSLTTPPCYETVIWTLFTERIEIDQTQLDVFRMLQTTAPGSQVEVNITNDFRPIQELHERNVISNDASTQQDVANQLVVLLREDIIKLKEDCKTGSAASTLMTSPVCVIRWVTSLVALWLLLGLKVVGRL